MDYGRNWCFSWYDLAIVVWRINLIRLLIPSSISEIIRISCIILIVPSYTRISSGVVVMILPPTMTTTTSMMTSLMTVCYNLKFR